MTLPMFLPGYPTLDDPLDTPFYRQMSETNFADDSWIDDTY